jgi:DNA-binding NarL/FixJ family response regulator
LKALASGAHGFVLKDASCALVIKAVRATHAGETWVQRELIGQLTGQLRRTGTLAPQRDTAASLTQRQQDVLSLLAVGNSTAEIAKALFVSQSTVRVHLTRILGKLGLKNRIEAVRYAIKEGLVSL